MADIVLDFETKSGIDLTIHGKQRYLNDSQADIICLGYKINNKSTLLWYPGLVLPDFTKEITSHTLYAFNAQFDYDVWQILGKKYKFPSTSLSQWVDVMAICGRFTFHQSLAQAGEDLNLKVKKNPRGKALMKKICEHPFEYSHIELMEFYSYCKTDVDTTYELLNALPASTLSVLEQKAWLLTCEMNANGLPIDIQAVKQILSLTNIYKEEQSKLLPGLTGGNVTKATQVIRIKNWMRDKGIITPNLQVGMVENLLERLDLPDDVKTVLQLRQELGKSSTAKYLKLSQLAYKNRVYDNERYYGSNTGRWAGMSFQLKNLPRSDVKDAEPIIKQFKNLSIIENDPISAAKSIIRGMICAPEGKMICAADYSAIEYIILCWVVEDKDAIVRFEEGFDQYVDMAVYLYSVAYEEIDSDQRYFGKQLVLGCGYGLGGKGFLDYAKARGLDISAMRAIEGVEAYRQKYNKVVKLWYACKDAAINALTYPGKKFEIKKCKFKLVKDRTGIKWLQLTLPSGRPLYYNKPEIGEGKFGPEVKAMGINPYTKKWARMSVIPGRFVENIIQALSRDILLNGKLELKKAGYKILGSIHDEVLLEVPEEPSCLEDVCKLMCAKPSWASDLPLKAEGMFEKRYRKM